MSVTMISKFSQHQKILTVMARGEPDKWYFPYDFMRDDLGDLFVGYEASARLSELAHDYPEMMESRRDGKYFKRRLRMATMSEWLGLLPKDLRYVLHRAGVTKGVQSVLSDVNTEQVANETDEDHAQTISVIAVYRGHSHPELDAGKIYGLVMQKLQVGKPIVIIKPVSMTYQDIAKFRKDWGAAT